MKSPKKELRDAVLKKRDALSPGERSEKSRAIQDLLFGLERWPPRGPVLFFHTMRTEVDTAPMMQRALDGGIPVALPRVAGDGLLELAFVTRLTEDLAESAWGIPEPTARCRGVDPSALDIIIVPGVAFDPEGYRVGYGGGFYDRLLVAAPKALRLALSFELQRVRDVPRMSHDIPADLLVTEKGVTFFANRTLP
ncbi:MAG: 5-formyltetrahydrofolate cyclo-ligase [Planctomycetota bacterium]